MSNLKIIKGNFLHTPTADRFIVHENAYMIIDNGLINGIYEKLPEEFSNVAIIDEQDKMIIPGFTDVHLHAPQFNNVGLGMDMQLLDWLNTYTFPEESSFRDMAYAENVYKNLINTLFDAGTLHFVAFGSIFKDTTIKLAEMVDNAGLKALIGKVNMDSNSPDFYVESTQQSIKDTDEYIEALSDLNNVSAIVTPRFVPSCSADLMKELAKLAKDNNLFIQSHLNENRGEIAWVAELFPEYDSYLDVYDKMGLLQDKRTIMAHCIWMSDRDIATLKDKQIMVAHCPFSNVDLASGIAPIFKMLQNNVPIALASDISGGHEIYMPRIIALSAELAKLNKCHIHEDHDIPADSEFFYMATKAGSYFFENTGSFENGYKADYLVVDDSSITTKKPENIINRLMRFIYTGNSSMITKRVVNGQEIKRPF